MIATMRDKFFPAELGAGVRAVPVTGAVFNEAVSQLAGQLFTPLTELGNFKRPAARVSAAADLAQIQRDTHHERFLFYGPSGEPVGWSHGHMLDGETFFMSWAGVLPDWQRQGLYSQFVGQLLAYLTALGYERVSSNHMVNNRPVLIAKLKLGFNVTALTLDERFGAQVTLTYFCHADRGVGFARAFSLEAYG